MPFVLLYLGAITTANLIVTAYGPAASILTALVFIGLDLTARDYLHEQWQGKNLALKMAALILTGSIISYLINRNAGPIALASFVAFAAAGFADAVVYQWLKKKNRLLKINGSNTVSSAVDSVLFPTLAFGALMPEIVIGQFLVKILGGAVWSVIIDLSYKVFKRKNGMHSLI